MTYRPARRQIYTNYLLSVELKAMIFKKLLKSSAGIAPQAVDDDGRPQASQVHDFRIRVLAYGYHRMMDHGTNLENVRADLMWYPREPYTSKHMAGMIWTRKPTEDEQTLIDARTFDQRWKEKNSEHSRQLIRPPTSTRPHAEIEQYLHFRVDRMHTNILRVCKEFHALGTSILYGENEFVFRSCRTGLQASCEKKDIPEMIRTYVNSIFGKEFNPGNGNTSNRDPVSTFMRLIGQKNVALITRLVLIGAPIYFQPINAWKDRAPLDTPEGVHHIDSLRVQTIALHQYCPNLRKLTLHREGLALHMTPERHQQTHNIIGNVVRMLPTLRELKLGYYADWFKSSEDHIDWGSSSQWESVVKNRVVESVLTHQWLENLRSLGQIFKEVPCLAVEPIVQNVFRGETSRKDGQKAYRVRERCIAAMDPGYAILTHDRGHGFTQNKRKPGTLMEALFDKRRCVIPTAKAGASRRIHTSIPGRRTLRHPLYKSAYKVPSRQKVQEGIKHTRVKTRKLDINITHPDMPIISLLAADTQSKVAHGGRDFSDIKYKDRYDDSGSNRRRSRSPRYIFKHQSTRERSPLRERQVDVAQVAVQKGLDDFSDSSSITTEVSLSDSVSDVSYKELRDDSPNPGESLDKTCFLRQNVEETQNGNMEAQLVNLGLSPSEDQSKVRAPETSLPEANEDNTPHNQDTDIAKVATTDSAEKSPSSTDTADATAQTLLAAFQPQHEDKESEIQTEVAVTEVDNIAMGLVKQPLETSLKAQSDDKQSLIKAHVVMTEVATAAEAPRTPPTSAQIVEWLSALLAYTIIMYVAYVLFF